MTIIKIVLFPWYCLIVATVPFGLYLVVKGIIRLIHRNVKSGLAYILIGIILSLLAIGILLPALARAD